MGQGVEGGGGKLSKLDILYGKKNVFLNVWGGEGGGVEPRYYLEGLIPPMP